MRSDAEKGKQHDDASAFGRRESERLARGTNISVRANGASRAEFRGKWRGQRAGVSQ